MNRTMMTSVLVATLAGFAGAEMMLATPAPFISRANDPTAPLLAASRSSTPPSPVPPTTAGVPQPTRPPVPLKLTYRPPVATATATAPSTGTGSDEAAPSVDAAARGGQMSEKAAKEAIEADGYKGVQMLSQGGDGVWRASALRGRTRILVNVDPAGTVSAE